MDTFRLVIVGPNDDGALRKTLYDNVTVGGYNYTIESRPSLSGGGSRVWVVSLTSFSSDAMIEAADQELSQWNLRDDSPLIWYERTHKEPPLRLALINAILEGTKFPSRTNAEAIVDAIIAAVRENLEQHKEAD